MCNEPVIEEKDEEDEGEDTDEDEGEEEPKEACISWELSILCSTWAYESGWALWTKVSENRPVISESSEAEECTVGLHIVELLN